MRDIVMYGALVGQTIGAIGGMVVVVLMFRRRAKERRERAARDAGRSLTPPAAPAQDRPDWRGAPAGKPR
jgi:gas vesicle protein